MGVIKDPIICKCCFDSLNTHNSFLNDCIELEKTTGHKEVSQPDIQLLHRSVEVDDIKTEVVEFEEMQIKSEYIGIKSEEKQRWERSLLRS